LPLTFTIGVLNGGGTTAFPVRVIDTPPATFVYTGFETTAGTCTLLGSITGGELECNIGTLLPGAGATITIQGFVPDEGTVVNSATVDPFGDVAEFNESNNTASVTVNVTTPPTPTPSPTSSPTPTATRTPIPPPGDLAAAIFDSVDPVINGSTVTYTMTITNVGSGPVGEEIDFSTGQPIGVHAFVQHPTQFAITGFTTDFQGECLYISGARELHCDYGIFDGGEVATITLTGTLASATDTTVSFSFLVDMPTSETQEAIEFTNNLVQQQTTIIGPTPTPTRTATRTPTITNTPTVTNTPTITPTPTPMPWDCADFNDDGRVTIGDIIFVIQQYFTSHPGADFDDDGNVTVTDILIAMSQYLIVCPT
jgi:hypothetical protein